MINIKKIINYPVSSNCYVITNKNSNLSVIVDPGTIDCRDLIFLLQEQNLYPEYIILTHEHIDHTIGLIELFKKYKPKLICSENCSKNINSIKYNLTAYTENFEEYAIMPKADILLEDIKYTLQWGDSKFNFYEAEGHSLGSIFFDIDNNLFIGDTLIKGYKTNTQLPGASKEKLIATLEKITSLYDPSKTRVYPGHGEDFYLAELTEYIYSHMFFLKTKIYRSNLICR